MTKKSAFFSIEILLVSLTLITIILFTIISIQQQSKRDLEEFQETEIQKAKQK